MKEISKVKIPSYCYCPPYLTKGKKYKILNRFKSLGKDGNYYSKLSILDDNKNKIFIDFSFCKHLNGGSWEYTHIYDGWIGTFGIFLLIISESIFFSIIYHISK